MAAKTTDLTAKLSAQLSTELKETKDSKDSNELSKQTVILTTARLTLCEATLDHMLLYEKECSTISELKERKDVDYEKLLQEFEPSFSDPLQVKWILSKKSPFRQYSIFLKNGEFVGRIRVHIPSGENRAKFIKGSDSACPSKLTPGFSEMSIFLLHKFQGKGYGPEAVQALLKSIIEPLVGTKPMVYAGLDTDQNMIFEPMQRPFLGVIALISMLNFHSQKANRRAGFAVCEFIPEDREGFLGDLYFKFPPSKSDPNETNQQFMEEFSRQVSIHFPGDPAWLDQPYVRISNDGVDNVEYCAEPQLYEIYLSLRDQFFPQFSYKEDEQNSFAEKVHSFYVKELSTTLDEALPTRGVDLICGYLFNLRKQTPKTQVVASSTVSDTRVTQGMR